LAALFPTLSDEGLVFRAAQKTDVPDYQVHLIAAGTKVNDGLYFGPARNRAGADATNKEHKINNIADH
jgi:hypothetical protein